MTLKFDVWPWKTIGHLFYPTSSSLHHFIAIISNPLFLQIRFAKVDQHIGGKWLIHGTKHHKDNQLPSIPIRNDITLWNHNARSQVHFKRRDIHSWPLAQSHLRLPIKTRQRLNYWIILSNLIQPRLVELQEITRSVQNVNLNPCYIRGIVAVPTRFITSQVLGCNHLLSIPTNRHIYIIQVNTTLRNNLSHNKLQWTIEMIFHYSGKSQNGTKFLAWLR